MVTKIPARSLKRVRARRTAPRPGADTDYIRVVPLHHPSTSGPVPVAAQPKLTYRGGPLLQSVEVFTIFWGASWGPSGPSYSLVAKLNQFFGAVLVSPAIDQLGEYDVPGQTIGHGSLSGTTTITTKAPSSSITDGAIRTQLKKWIAAKAVPKTNKNTLYFLYLDPGVISVMGGSRSCQSFCGYHSNVGNVFYAVVPFPSCAGCLAGQSVLDALTSTSSHELCEAITDPIPGSGWYDDANGEIGDICAWKSKMFAGFNLQLEWSNTQGKCV